MTLEQKMLVRQMELKEADLSQILQIETSAFNSFDAYDREDFRRWFRRNPDLCLVAEIEGRIAGYGIARILADKAELASLATHSDFRRLGVGSALLQEIIRRVEMYEVQQIELEVRKTNLDGFQFWKKMGFCPVGELPRFYEDGEDAIQMRKYL